MAILIKSVLIIIEDFTIFRGWVVDWVKEYMEYDRLQVASRVTMVYLILAEISKHTRKLHVLIIQSVKMHLLGSINEKY